MDKDFENEFTEKMLSLCLRLEKVSQGFFKKKNNERVAQCCFLLIDVISHPENYTDTSISFSFSKQAFGIEKLVKDLWTMISNYDFKKFLEEIEGWRYQQEIIEMYNPLIKHFELDIEERFKNQEAIYIFNEFGDEKNMNILLSKGFSQS